MVGMINFPREIDHVTLGRLNRKEEANATQIKLEINAVATLHSSQMSKVGRTRVFKSGISLLEKKTTKLAQSFKTVYLAII